MQHFRDPAYFKLKLSNYTLISRCSRVVEAAPDKVVVIPATGKDVAVQLRNQDSSWKTFLSSAYHLPRYATVDPVVQQSSARPFAKNCSFQNLHFWQMELLFTSLPIHGRCHQYPIFIWYHRLAILLLNLVSASWFCDVLFYTSDAFSTPLQEIQKLYHGLNFLQFVVLLIHGHISIFKVEMFVAGLQI